MHRFIAGAVVVAFALTGCGSRIAAGPPRHIVALPVATTEAPAPVPAPAPPVAASRASRSATPVRLASVGTPAVVGADVWTRLARCESGGNPKAVSRNGRYFGAFQFVLSSWHAVGMSGNPVDYDYATQLAAAQRLQARSGWRNWPVCSRRVRAV